MTRHSHARSRPMQKLQWPFVICKLECKVQGARQACAKLRPARCCRGALSIEQLRQGAIYAALDSGVSSMGTLHCACACVMYSTVAQLQPAQCLARLVSCVARVHGDFAVHTRASCCSLGLSPGAFAFPLCSCSGAFHFHQRRQTRTARTQPDHDHEHGGSCECKECECE